MSDLHAYVFSYMGDDGFATVGDIAVTVEEAEVACHDKLNRLLPLFCCNVTKLMPARIEWRGEGKQLSADGYYAFADGKLFEARDDCWSIMTCARYEYNGHIVAAIHSGDHHIYPRS